MADWWNSTQKGAQEAAETTKFVSMRTKLQAEVMYIENQIKTCLQKFGVEVFPHMENNNSAQVQQHFTDTKREVENYREQIAAKNVEIAELNKQIENIGKAEGK
jgi:transposase